MLSSHTPNPANLPASVFAHDLWLHKIRFIGAGSIAVASLWTLVELLPPVISGIRQSLTPSDSSTATHERDLSPLSMAGLLGLSAFGLWWFFRDFLGPVTTGAGALVLAAVLFCIVFGFLMAAACGYMAGIVGSSSSPISGIIIVGAVLSALMILALETLGLVPSALMANGQKLATAFTILLLSAITATIAISNDNLQDLKTGQLVGASPWKQEAVLIVGCVVGSLVIPPVLNLLYQAYGFAGAMPRPGMDPARALSAPQPALITMITQGIFSGTLDWSMLGAGLALGCVLIVADRLLRRHGLSLPPLGVAVGLYLPASTSMTLAGGAVLGWVLRAWVKRNAPAEHDTQAWQTRGTMLASGFIVGESLTGVAVAGLSGASGHDDTLSVASALPAAVPDVLGALAFCAACLWFARSFIGGKEHTLSP